MDYYGFMCVFDIMSVCFGDPPLILATQYKSQGQIDTLAHLPPDLGSPASTAQDRCLLTPKTADPLPLLKEAGTIFSALPHPISP